jgi:DNA-directed RNA polymerase specialized sigma24 family protein
VHRALSLPPADDEYFGAPSALTGILTHLDAVYGFALTLTGDSESAEQVTEDVFGSVHDELWTTLGGHGLRDRLLARCVTVFRGAVTPHRASPGGDELGARLLGLPWDARAAIALVDQLGLTYAAGAAVLGIEVAEFRARLHQARSVLFAAYRAGTR